MDLDLLEVIKKIFSDFGEDSQLHKLNHYGPEFIEALVKTLDTNTHDNDVKRNLIAAAMRFKTPAAIGLLRGVSSSEESVDDLNRLFASAVKFDQKEVMEELLKDARVDPLGHNSETGENNLHYAVRYDSLNAMDLLISLGVEIDAMTNNGYTALHYAVDQSTRRGEKVSILLRHGASSSIKSTVGGMTAWHVAVKDDNELALKALLALAGDNCQAQLCLDDAGYTPLFLAARQRSIVAFEMLLFHTESLEDLPAVCPEGLGLVHYAASLNSAKALRILLDKGSNLAQRARDNKNALHFVPGNSDIEIIELLVEAGLKVSSVDNNGARPIHILCSGSIAIEQKVFDIFAAKGLSQSKTTNGLTPLHYTFQSTERTALQETSNFYWKMAQISTHEILTGCPALVCF